MRQRGLFDVLAIKTELNTEDREEEITDLAKDSKNLSELKAVMLSNGLEIELEKTNEDILSWVNGDCAESEYCTRDNCAECKETDCDTIHQTVGIENCNMAEYIMQGLGVKRKHRAWGNVGIIGYIGNNLYSWSVVRHYDNGDTLANLVFILYKENQH